MNILSGCLPCFTTLLKSMEGDCLQGFCLNLSSYLWKSKRLKRERKKKILLARSYHEVGLVGGVVVINRQELFLWVLVGILLNLNSKS